MQKLLGLQSGILNLSWIMNNSAIHYWETPLVTSAAGHEDEKMLIIAYLINRAIPAYCEMGGAEISPAEPISIEILRDKIRIRAERHPQGCNTIWHESMKEKCLEPEHLEAIEREILEGLE